MAQTARLSTRSNDIIEEITSITHSNKIEIIEKALETYRHLVRMRQLNKSYQVLRSNRTAWNQEKRERKILEGTLSDGLEKE